MLSVLFISFIRVFLQLLLSKIESPPRTFLLSSFHFLSTSTGNHYFQPLLRNCLTDHSVFFRSYFSYKMRAEVPAVEVVDSVGFAVDFPGKRGS